MNKIYTVVKSGKEYRVSGTSYLFNNFKTAEKLCNHLNDYEKQLEVIPQIQKNFNEADKQLKQALMSLNILKADMDKVKRNLRSGMIGGEKI